MTFKLAAFLLPLFFFLSHIALGQDWRYVKEKKVYHSLEEALNNKDDVYNLLLLQRVNREKLHLIGEMKHIQYLGLPEADLDSLPASIFSLPNIRTLNLCGNRFTKIPEGIRRLKKLEYLVMYDNEIREIPAWIGELTNLETLILPRNKIDSISPGIGRLYKLSDLSLGENMIRHLPATIGELHSLRELGLHQNKLSRLPEEISRLKKLEILHVNNNQLSCFPEELGWCSNLELIQAGSNLLTHLPVSLSRLNNLKTLGLENNPFDSMTENFIFPPQLKSLNLTGKAIRQMPASLRNCKSLQHLEITKTAITFLPLWLNELKELNWLVLDDNRLVAISDLQGLRKLRVFRVSGNLLDTLPGNILLLPELETVDITNNPIRHFPVQIKNALKLTYFNIQSTEITNAEYKTYRKFLGKSMILPHDKIMYFEDEDGPCYIDSLTNTNDVFTHIEVYPSFMKGTAAWHNFVRNNLHEDSIAGMQDSVVLKYIIREGGGLANLRVLNYKFEQTRNEAIRLMKLSCPYWVPANISGRKVSLWRRQVFVFDGQGIRVMDHPEDPQTEMRFLYESSFIVR
ncbi:Leucine-rich repeat (LRR) protein [Chitinophaga rupis]|uniref:Leucine-rich repeat (LRR) protein n=1 Tax=Chitinophaga rupis TaxID=573321 RepID=A0A1H7ZYU1_9BACT|nr:leucine-rich repeat domain-containing protein [Chitinophaga rupis]SEM62884.1 Leucine-rich repeat (LRR) protein [Chitinophaga rupis]